MTGEQLDDHCLIPGYGKVWRVLKVEGFRIRAACDCCGAVTRFKFPDGFDFTPYCDSAAMLLAAENARQERNGLPVSAGSGARN